MQLLRLIRLAERKGGYTLQKDFRLRRLSRNKKGPQQRLWLGAKENNKAGLFTARKLTRFLELKTGY